MQKHTRGNADASVLALTTPTVASIDGGGRLILDGPGGRVVLVPVGLPRSSG